MGGASGGAQNGFSGPSGGMGQGGFAAPGTGSAGPGHPGHGGASGSGHDTPHSSAGAVGESRGDSHRGTGGGTASGFGATVPNATAATGAKSVIVAPPAHHRSATGRLADGESFAADSHFQHRRDRFHHHAIPFLFVTGIGTVPVVTETESAIGADIESQSFTVSNDTDAEMTVLDSGVQICVLAPRARCSFETTSGHHDISVTVSGRQSSDLEDRAPHGGHMIAVGREAD